MKIAEEALSARKEPSWPAHHILALAFLDTHRYEEALKHAGKLGEQGLMESGKQRVKILQDASEFAGRALYSMGKYSCALKEFQGGLRVTPDEDEKRCILFQLHIGRVFRAAGNATVAYQIFCGIVSNMEEAEAKGTG